MTKKEKYKDYKFTWRKDGEVICINLGDTDYQVFAVIKFCKKEKTNFVSLVLKEKNTGYYDEMEKFEKLDSGDERWETVFKVTRFIEDTYKKGGFDYYIGRYERMLHYIDIGLNAVNANPDSELKQN